MNTGRTHDIKELYKELDTTSDPVLKNKIKHSINLIKGESGRIRSMREKLVMAHRSGNVEEVKDIHDYIKNKWQYRNE
jgi:hypothetical protein